MLPGLGGSFCPSLQRIVLLSVTNRNPVALSGPLLSVTNRNPVALSGPLLSKPSKIVVPGLGGSCLSTVIRNKSHYRILVVLSGPLLSVTNRTPGSWWLFLAHSYPQQIVPPDLGGSFWPTLIRNKSYSRFLVAVSGQLLSVANRTPGS